jgi:hypothetical protein
MKTENKMQRRTPSEYCSRIRYDQCFTAKLGRCWSGITSIVLNLRVYVGVGQRDCHVSERASGPNRLHASGKRRRMLADNVSVMKIKEDWTYTNDSLAGSGPGSQSVNSICLSTCPCGDSSSRVMVLPVKVNDDLHGDQRGGQGVREMNEAGVGNPN